MISLNIANFITIGLIAMLFMAALQWAASAMNIDISWLT